MLTPLALGHEQRAPVRFIVPEFVVEPEFLELETNLELGDTPADYGGPVIEPIPDPPLPIRSAVLPLQSEAQDIEPIPPPGPSPPSTDSDSPSTSTSTSASEYGGDVEYSAPVEYHAAHTTPTEASTFPRH